MQVARLLAPTADVLVHLFFFATQPVAHVTPFPGAKQLGKAASYSRAHSEALAEPRQTFLSAAACLRQAAVFGLNASTRVVVVVDDLTVVVVVVFGCTGAVVVVVGRFGAVVAVVLVVVVVVLVGRVVVVVLLDLTRVVVVVVGRGRVVVVVLGLGFEQAITHASYLARAAAMQAGSRFTHCPPSLIHWFWQLLTHPELPPLDLPPDVEARTAKLANVTAAMASATAGSIRNESHLAVSFTMLVGFVAIAADPLSKSDALEGLANARKTRHASAGAAAPLQHAAIASAKRPTRSCDGCRRSAP